MGVVTKWRPEGWVQGATRRTRERMVGRHGNGSPESLLVIGHITTSDDSVGTGSMGVGFVWLDCSKWGSEHIGREEEVTSSGRAEMRAYTAILRRTPDHEDLVTATDNEVLYRVVVRWVGRWGKTSLANTADADISEYILTKLAARIAAKSRTFLVKVKAHRGEPLNEGADDLAETGREPEEGENSRCQERTTRVVYPYYDRNLRQWKKGKWTKTVRNAARRRVTESLMEERLQIGANKWWKGLFEERSVEADGDSLTKHQSHPHGLRTSLLERERDARWYVMLRGGNRDMLQPSEKPW